MKKLKSLKLMLLAVVALCSSNAFAEDTSAGGFNISVDGSGKATITSLSVDNAVAGGILTIKSTLPNTKGADFKVVGIAADAFVGVTASQRTAITSIVIEDENVATIGARAFRGLTNVTQVTIGKAVKKIYASAFEGCSKLSKVIFPAGGIVDELGVDAFKGTVISDLDLTNTKLTQINNLFGSTYAYGAILYTNGDFDDPLSAKYHNAHLDGAKSANDYKTFYTAAEAAAANEAATIPGIINTGTDLNQDQIDALVALGSLEAYNVDDHPTAGDVILYNSSAYITDENAVHVNDGKDKYTQDEADTYNSKAAGNLVGAVDETDVRVKAVAVTPFASLTKVTLPATWTTLGVDAVNTPGAFENCLNLATVVFNAPAKNDQVQTINPKAFLGTALTSLDLTNTHVTVIPTTILVDVAKAVTPLATSNNTLATFIPSASLITIETQAFNSCLKLTPVTFPEGSALLKVGDYAFGNTPLMTSIDLSNCKKIANFTTASYEKPFIPAGGETNDVLTTVKLPNGDGTSGTSKFVNPGVALASLTVLTTIENISNLTTIANGAFAGDAALESLSLPNTVETIGTGAFNGCTSLETLIIAADKLTTISGALFDDAAKGALKTLKLTGDISHDDTEDDLKDVTTTINGGAFANCTAITTLEIAKDKEVSVLLTAATAGTFQVADNATVTIGKVSRDITGWINALGNVTTLTVGEIATAQTNATISVAAGKKITEIIVGKISANNSSKIFGRAAKITFGDVAAQITTGVADNVLPELTEIVFAGKINNTASLINAATFDEAKAPKLEEVTYQPTANIPNKKVFDQAAFGTGSVGDANATVTLNTKPAIADLYGRSEAQLYNVKFESEFAVKNIAVDAPAGSAYFYGKLYEPKAYTIAKTQDDANVIVYGAYVDQEDNGKIYMEQFRLYDGKYWIPANTPVVVKSSVKAEVVAQQQSGVDSRVKDAYGNWISEIAVLDADCAGQALMTKVNDKDWTTGVNNIDNIDYDIYAMAKTSTYGMSWKRFGQATNLKAGLFYVRCAKGGAPAPEQLEVIWNDGSEESNTTGIENVNVAKQFNGEIFNLQGIRVSEPVKGQIYIQNGKKFMMK